MSEPKQLSTLEIQEIEANIENQLAQARLARTRAPVEVVRAFIGGIGTAIAMFVAFQWMGAT